MNIEDFNETIHKLYDIGLTKPSLLNSDQRHAFYYLDFIYSYEMGGFLYNTSPANSSDNFFRPYVECCRFFGLDNMADKFEEYQNLYVKALVIYEEKKETDFKIIMKDVGLDRLEKEVNEKIEIVYKEKRTWKWLENNVDKLKIVE
jgi:hypothetical protein